MSIEDPAAPTPAAAAGGVPPPPRAGGGANPPPRRIPLTGYLPVDVSGGHLENVQVSLVQGITIPGRFVIEGATGANPGANPQRGLSLNLVREPDVVGVPNAQIRGGVQQDGSLNLQNVGPGEYRLYVPPLIAPFSWTAPNVPQGMQNMYVKSARMGNDDLLQNPLRVFGGTAPGEIVVTLGPGGRFSGTAMNDRREPVPNVTVVLVPNVSSRPRREVFRHVSTDLSGRFSMQGIPAATYKAYAFEEVPVDAWHSPEFLRPLESRSSTVSIRDGDLTSTDLTVIPAVRR
jgi:hypothetical protein